MVKTDKKFDAVILAAGRGKRTGRGLSKMLLTINGDPIIIRLLRNIISFTRTVKRVIVVVGYDKDAVKNVIQSEFGKKNIIFCSQEKLDGTAGALRVAMKKIVSPNVIVFCGDLGLLDKNTIRGFVSAFKRKDCSGMVMTAVSYRDDKLGIVKRDERGRIERVIEAVEVRRENGLTEINGGVYIFKQELLRKLLKKIRINRKKKEYFITDIFELAYKHGYQIFPYKVDYEKVMAVNTLEDLFFIRQRARQKKLKTLISTGVDIIDPQTVYVDDNVKIGKDTIIYPFTIIEKDVIIGNRCKVGPFAHLREGTIIDDDTEVGNFTELVRTHLGKYVKMKHFSYLGDARVDGSVNIGAGVVSANYDGKRKNKTYIASNAFIGSDTILVAPVRVGKKALTGAGSVVTKDVEDNTKVVGVPAKPLYRRGPRK